MSDVYRELFILKMPCFHSRDKVKYIYSKGTRVVVMVVEKYHIAIGCYV